MSEDSKTIVLSTGTRVGSRRKIPLKLLKIKKESKESPLQVRKSISMVKNPRAVSQKYFLLRF